MATDKHIDGVDFHPDMRKPKKQTVSFTVSDEAKLFLEYLQEHYKTNVSLDNLWYRFVNNNNRIFISNNYRDYINVLIKLGFKQLYYKLFKEKEITKYECN